MVVSLVFLLPEAIMKLGPKLDAVLTLCPMSKLLVDTAHRSVNSYSFQNYKARPR